MLLFLLSGQSAVKLTFKKKKRNLFLVLLKKKENSNNLDELKYYSVNFCRHIRYSLQITIHTISSLKHLTLFNPSPCELHRPLCTLRIAGCELYITGSS